VIKTYFQYIVSHSISVVGRKSRSKPKRSTTPAHYQVNILKSSTSTIDLTSHSKTFQDKVRLLNFHNQRKDFRHLYRRHSVDLLQVNGRSQRFLSEVETFLNLSSLLHPASRIGHGKANMTFYTKSSPRRRTKWRKRSEDSRISVTSQTISTICEH
jgi:hypothetical protein